MLHLVTGTPGAKKTAFVVTQLDKLESKNKANLALNQSNYNKNLEVIAKHDLQSEFSYLEYEVGSGHELQRKVKAFDSDYFAMFAQDFDDLRPDDYFKRSIEYNQIITRIVENYGIKDLLGLAPVRTIYTNINNLKIDYVRANVYDWRQCPDGSVIVIDEVQLVSPYDDIKSKDNEIVQSLTIHRHRGFDFYFITQAPMLLHPTVKVLIGVHYHLTVPFGLRTRVYQYGSTRDNPNALINKTNCERKFDFSPPNRIFKLYKSTTINTHKARFPYKMIFVLITFVAICFYVIYANLSNARKSALFGGATEQETLKQAQTAPNPATQDTQNPIDTQTNMTQETVAQEHKQELHKKYLSEYTVEVADDPVVLPASVIAMGGKCEAYNQYGDRLNIPNKQCLDMLSDYGKIPKRRDGYSQTSSQKNDVFSEYRQDEFKEPNKTNNVDKIDDKT